MEKTYREKILEIEKELELETFTYKGLGIWPVIRLSIILSRPKTNKVVNVSFIKKLKFLAVGVLEFLKWQLGFWPKSKNIFLTSSHYKVKENGVWYDRIIDPFLSWLESKGEDFIVFDFTNNFSYNELSYSRRSIRVQPVIYLLSFLWKIQFIFSKRKKTLSGNVELFNKLMKRNDLSFRIDENFRRRLFLLEKQSKFFEKILLKMSATHVGLVCYYDFKSMALTWASNRLHIPSIDFQHGVQHSLHLAYNQWPKPIIKNSPFIPSHFYVWNQFSLENIAQWHSEEKIINGGNKWIRDRILFSEKNIILYTVQPIEDPIPSFLIEAIKQYSGEKEVYIRLHPQQLVEYRKIENFLKENNVLKKVNIKDATYKPLTDILANTAIHITKSSSVAIEASEFNVPTVFIHDRGKYMYEPMLPSRHLFYASESDQLLNFLNTDKDLPEKIESNGSLPPDRFGNIENFYGFSFKKQSKGL